MAGHIRQRGKDPKRWTLVLEPPRVDGKRQNQKYTSFRGTRSEALRELARRQTKLEEGSYVNPNGPLLSEYLPRWLASVEHSVERTTYEKYEARVRKLLLAFGGIRIARLTSDHLRTQYTKWLEEGLSPASILKTRTVLYSAFEAARLSEPPLIHRNVVETVKPPRNVKTEIETLTVEELMLLLEKAEPTPLYAPISIAVYVGARLGECLGLRWSDIDFESKTVSLSQVVVESQKNGVEIRPRMKTVSSRRKLPISDDLISILKHVRARQASEKLAAGPVYADHDLVCARKDGRPYRPTHVSTAFGKLVERIGLKDITFHALRHTHATILADAGVALNTIKDRLGHSSYRLTADLYSHVTPMQQSDAITKLDRRLKG